MKEGVDKLALSAFKTATYTRDIISNVPAVKYYEQMQYFVIFCVYFRVHADI